MDSELCGLLNPGRQVTITYRHTDATDSLMFSVSPMLTMSDVWIGLTLHRTLLLTNYTMQFHLLHMLTTLLIFWIHPSCASVFTLLQFMWNTLPVNFMRTMAVTITTIIIVSHCKMITLQASAVVDCVVHHWTLLYTVEDHAILYTAGLIKS